MCDCESKQISYADGTTLHAFEPNMNVALSKLEKTCYFFPYGFKATT